MVDMAPSKKWRFEGWSWSGVVYGTVLLTWNLTHLATPPQRNRPVSGWYRDQASSLPAPDWMVGTASRLRGFVKQKSKSSNLSLFLTYFTQLG